MSDKKITGNTNREAIELFLVSEEGSVELSEKQKQLLQRWQYCDELIRRNEMTRESIAKLLMFKFKPLSRTTAYQDIVNTEAVFSSSTPLNKKYWIQNRIEFLQMKISELYGMVQMKPMDEAGDQVKEEEEDIQDRLNRISANQEYMHEAKELEKVLQKYIHDYPDMAPLRSPKMIVMNVQNNVLPAAPLSVADALEQAKKIIHLKSRNDGRAAES